MWQDFFTVTVGDCSEYPCPQCGGKRYIHESSHHKGVMCENGHWRIFDYEVPNETKKHYMLADWSPDTNFIRGNY